MADILFMMWPEPGHLNPTCRRQHENYSTSIQRWKRGTRTEYIARLTYYDKTGKRKGLSRSAATHCHAKRELQDLIDHVRAYWCRSVP